MDIKVFKENEKLDDAYNYLASYIDSLVNQYQLTYFELFGIIEAIKSDLYNSDVGEE